MRGCVVLCSGESEGKQYHVELEFFKEVQPEGSVWKVLPRSIQMNVKKVRLLLLACFLQRNTCIYRRAKRVPTCVLHAGEHR